MRLRFVAGGLLAAFLGAGPTPSGPGLLPPTPSHDDEGMSHPLALAPVTGGREGRADVDLRVNDGYRVGEVVLCHLQSEASVAAHDDAVYVAYNDTRQCLLQVPGVRRSGSGFARSTDGGKTFQDLGPLIPESGAVDFLAGDPALAIDTRGEDEGTIYYSSLAGGSAGTMAAVAYEGVAVGVSRDQGETFEWVDASGPDPARDKPWIAVDNSGGPHDGNVYVTWSHTGSPRAIRLVRSEDGGRTWSVPLTLEGGTWMSGPRPIVDADGTVHVVWLFDGDHTALHYARSTDGGRTFTSPEEVARFPEIADTGECPGYRAVNGKIRVYSMPSIAVDTFGSPQPGDAAYNPDRGRVYVAWPALGTRPGDASDVWLATRHPGTGSWSAPLRINDDATTADQLFPEVVVPKPGHVLASWVDRREDPDNLLLRQYAAESDDAGAGFGSNVPASDVAFPPPNTFPNSDPLVAPCYAGDYNGLFADEDGQVYAAWTDHRDDLLVQGPAGQRTIPDPNVYFRVFTAA